MATAAELLVKIGADTSQFDKVIARTQKSLERTSKKLSGIGETMTKAFTVPLGLAAAAGYKFIQSASDLSETQSKVGVLFGESASAIDKWSDSASGAFGQSKQQAEDAAATFAIFGKSAGLTGTKLTDFSTEMTQLASDLASFNNTSPEQAIEAIGAALRGESEPIQAYGVLMNDASLRAVALKEGIVSTTKEALTPQQKVLAAHALILQQTTSAQGDFARTSDGLANKQRILTAQFADSSAKMGESLLPIALQMADVFQTKVLPVVQNVAGWFQSLSPGVQKTALVVGVLVAAIGPLLIGLGLMVSAVSSTILPLAKSAIQATATAYKWAFLGTEAKQSAVKVVASWASTAAAALKNAAVMVAQSAVMVAKWVWMGAQALAQAARIAAAWLIAMGPIGIITAAVIAIAVLIIANWDTIKNATVKVWESIAAFFSNLWPKITAALTAAWEAIKQFFIKFWPYLLVVFTGGTGLLVALLITHWDEVKAIVTKVWNGIKSFLSSTWDNIKASASKIFGNIASALSGVWDSITGKVKSVWDGITGTIKGAINSIIRLINSFISKFNSIHVSIPTIKIPSVTIAGKTFGGGTIGGQSFGVPKIPTIPQLATGTNDVPQDMLAQIHEGEAVVPKRFNPAAGGMGSGPVTIIVEMDGRQIAKGTAPHMVDLIRVKTGLRI